MHVKIKICGLQSTDEIKLMNKYQVDYIGFVFAPSKRRVSLAQAIQLKKHLDPKIKTVGVFVNEEINTVNTIAKALDLDIVQLHGEEDETYLSTMERSVWKAYKVDKSFNENGMINNNKIFGNLFDGKNPGTGETFNWESIRNIKCKNSKILAGGLNESNIEAAIALVKPDIIDVSSGVEKNNRKDEMLIESLIRRVRNV